ncbi:MAG: hypothetical protein IAA47_01975 [Candidatus Fusobacterium pullicola]|uniref:Uncharacterized protein n=1 Tax=Candidatus Fusobacterium pullicola TaxID=2838601 RepID=A0A9E2KY04_9FUSO|nr:hypothetical protein [Candidatus Fusobacterium pullicola]
MVDESILITKRDELKEKINKDKSIKKDSFDNLNSEYPNMVTKKYVTLFFSFDIVNSTQYKTIALQNSINIIREIFREIETLMDENIQIMQYWRTIGDEIIFYLEVYKMEEILESIEIVFAILNRVRKDILNEKIKLNCFDTNYRYKYPELISLKATAWLAIVSENDREAQNVKYKVGYMTNDKRLEFQGYDIDIGFRVAEYTRNRRFALSFELAYLISKYERYKDNLKFIGYRKMKGVWNQRKYPIIWYHNKHLKKLKDEENLDDNDFILEDFNKSFFYDEEEFCELTKEYISLNQEVVDEKNSQEITHLLDKICQNLNLTKKIDEIYKTINEKNLLVEI